MIPEISLDIYDIKKHDPCDIYGIKRRDSCIGDVTHA